MYEHPISPRTRQLLEKYGGVAYDYGALPKLVAVHILTSEDDISDNRLETNLCSLATSVNGMVRLLLGL